MLLSNWRCRLGEIDLICSQGDALVFVEVKCRLASKLAARHLLDSVSSRKQRKLRLLAECFMARHYWCKKYKEIRIDVIGVLIHAETFQIVRLEHLRAAV